MKKIIITALMLAVATNVFALQRKSVSQIDGDKLVLETQKSAPSGDDHVNLIWWIPFEFWEATFANDTTTSETDKQDILNTFKPYYMLAVVQADISPFGAFGFYTKDTIEKNMVVTFRDEKNVRHQLKLIETIDPDLELLLATFKPILGAAMGNLGNNLHFFVFSDRNKDRTRKISPYKTGQIMIQLVKSNNEIINSTIDLPLDSLFVPRKCPNGRDAHISWKYCPWSGTHLEE